jgi:hypothetical protein
MDARATPGRLVFLGCAVLLLFALLAMMFIVPRVLNLGKDAIELGKREIAEEKEWVALTTSWRPPPEDAGPDELFPALVWGLELTGHGEDAAVPEFYIDSPGRRATYQSDVASLEVLVYRMTEPEIEALYERVRETIEGADMTYRSVVPTNLSFDDRSTSRLTYSFGPPNQRGAFCWSAGWLFFAREAHDAAPDDFLRSYMGDISASDGAEATPSDGEDSPSEPSQ